MGLQQALFETGFVFLISMFVSGVAAAASEYDPGHWGWKRFLQICCALSLLAVMGFWLTAIWLGVFA
jgi:hypothetical protein